jgi:hypothetical protein
MLHLFVGYTVGTWLGHAYFLYKYPECVGRVPDPLGWECVWKQPIFTSDTVDETPK